MIGNPKEHPLLTKRIGGAIAVMVAGTGIGLALMGFALIKTGMAMSVIGAAGAISIYWPDFKHLRLRLAEKTGIEAAVHAEIWIVMFAIISSVAIPAYVWINQAWPKQQEWRLQDSERSKIIQSLSAHPGKFVYVNSASNCQQCEEYAEDIREAIAAAPNWTGSGGNTIFGNASIRGIKLQTTNIKNPDDLMREIAEAFNAANIRYEWADVSPNGYDAVYVGWPAMIQPSRPAATRRKCRSRRAWG
jgi:hypothetical protein